MSNKKQNNKAASKHIPIHQLKDWAINDLLVKHTNDQGSKDFLELLDVHRDDSYYFLLIEKGTGSIVVDFDKVSLKAMDIYFWVPGQVHYDINVRDGETWYIGVMPSLIPKEYLKIFESHFQQQQPRKLDERSFTQCQKIIQLLREQYNSSSDDIFHKHITYNLLNTFLSLAAKVYSFTQREANTVLRPAQITNEFKRLVTRHFKLEKKPSYYASQLSISEIYLNEVVKKTTGFTVTYWILSEIILEAKRMLCHSTLNVKEIAFALGYEDYTYFSRIFKKATDTTPLSFRNKCLK
jgi:AraC-like DNA-binding protein